MVINSSLVSYFQTGNPLIDGFIMMFIATATSYLFKNSFNLSIKNVITVCLSKKYKYSTKLLSYESNIGKMPYTNSSESYNAVNFYIKSKCTINEITQNYDSFNYNYDDDDNTSHKTGFDITQEYIFKIEDNIYGQFIEEVNTKKMKDDTQQGYKKKYLCLMSNISIQHLDKFIEKCIKVFHDYKEKETQKGPFIFTYTGIKKNMPSYEEKYFKTEQTLENSIFDNKNQIVNALEKFNNENYYVQHPQLTRKLIPLFYGEPGTGKTFCIRLIAKELNRNIIIVSLNKIKSIEELNSVLFFNKINNHMIKPDKCIFVLEDLDAMTDLLKNRKFESVEPRKTSNELLTFLQKSNKKSKKNEDSDDEEETDKKITLTFSNILNVLDGIYKLDNYVITFSTNHIEHLDPAFLRDQRITHKIEFKKCSVDIMKEFIEDWYKVNLSKDDISKLKTINNTLSLANLATLCDKYDSYQEVIHHL